MCLILTVVYGIQAIRETSHENACFTVKSQGDTCLASKGKVLDRLLRKNLIPRSRSHTKKKACHVAAGELCKHDSHALLTNDIFVGLSPPPQAAVREPCALHSATARLAAAAAATLPTRSRRASVNLAFWRSTSKAQPRLICHASAPLQSDWYLPTACCVPACDRHATSWCHRIVVASGQGLFHLLLYCS